MLTMALLLIATLLPTERIGGLLPTVKEVAEVSGLEDVFVDLGKGDEAVGSCASLFLRSGEGASCAVKSLGARGEDKDGQFSLGGQSFSLTCAPTRRTARPTPRKACEHLEANTTPTDATRLLQALIENNVSLTVLKLPDVHAVALSAFDASSSDEQSETVVWRDDRMAVLRSGCSPVARMDSVVGFASLLLTCREELIDAGASNRGWKTTLRGFDFRSELVELPFSEMEIARDEHPSGRDAVVLGPSFDLKKLTARCALEPHVAGTSVALTIKVAPTRQPEMQAIATRAGRWCFDVANGWSRCLSP